MADLPPGRFFYDGSKESEKEVAMEGFYYAKAYFIRTDSGEMMPVPHSHIALVISRPERFGLSAEFVRAVYAKHGERMGLEGKARVEILRWLIDKGFMRLRRYRHHWKVNINRLDAAAEALQRWARAVRALESDPAAAVIIDQRRGPQIKTDLAQLAGCGQSRPQG
jgi:hypothetical protein